jgi:hypothetical protein
VALTAFAEKFTGDDYKRSAVKATQIGKLSATRFTLEIVSQKRAYILSVASLPNGKVIYILANADTDVWGRAQPVLESMIQSITVLDIVSNTPTAAGTP